MAGVECRKGRQEMRSVIGSQTREGFAGQTGLQLYFERERKARAGSEQKVGERYSRNRGQPEVPYI